MYELGDDKDNLEDDGKGVDVFSDHVSWVEDQYDLKVLPSHYEESAYKEKIQVN